MKRKVPTESEMVKAVQELESCMEESQVRKLKQMYAELAWITRFWRTSSKKTLEPEVKKELADEIVKEYNVSISRACKLMDIHRSYFYYTEKKVEQAIRKAAEFGDGFWKIFQRIRRDGKPWNHKKVYRISSMTVTGLQWARRSLCRCPRKVLEKVIWLNGKTKNIRWPCVLSEKLFRTSSYHLSSVLYPDIYVHAISVQVLRCREIYVCIRRDDSLYICLPRSFLYQIYSLYTVRHWRLRTCKINSLHHIRPLYRSCPDSLNA